MAGRPSKFNAALSAKIVSLYREGKTDAEVAEIIGICVRTLQYWKGKHNEFLHSIKEAKGIADNFVEASLFQRAVGYDYKVEKAVRIKDQVIFVEVTKHCPPDVQAQMYWLNNRQPKLWGRR